MKARYFYAHVAYSRLNKDDCSSKRCFYINCSKYEFFLIGYDISDR